MTTTICIALKFLSTLSLRRATHYDNYNLHCVEISIHALLAESDANGCTTIPNFRYFYPRSPCGERRAKQAAYFSLAGISIHALLAESDSAFDVLTVSALLISIHALLAESDVRKRDIYHD